MISFLQSKEWEEFQKSVGRKTWRLGGALVIQHTLPLGFNYLYCPRPSAPTEQFFRETAKIAAREKSIFLKIDPTEQPQIIPRPPWAAGIPAKKGLGTNSPPLPRLRLASKFQTSAALQPQKSLVINLQKSEEDLLGAMYEKTRYNIRLAERHGVGVNQAGALEEFWKLLVETARRDKFYTHEQNYYEKLLMACSDNFSNELFFARQGRTLIAAALINFFKPSQTVTYLHGASLREHKEVMAPHLLHWRIMQDAKRRGFSFYDMWGIDEKKWPGITRFKLGFGGEVVEYPDSIDIIYGQFWYGIYKISKAVL
ncbi:MAG: peptidoglycan bridge formation glycyltransferase FemA/FemB family protein [Candidatus Sungiibacteriota bacterium]|uniref:Peptidoglycan bridge formation glycyltransferase FemA/FemB family protein n=1 Tax=Candidatus Sungiibacteriota bacterium TaxID=2750080 RepID=A0A7T5RIV1_9BACT|nr:MAG: peptidoglycan bridge formation glycyltransferase FemA/FemB family protein [Candidatus Sungbacteria bacterium]